MNIAIVHLYSGRAFSPDEMILFSADAAMEHLESPEEALEELRRLYSYGDQLNRTDYLGIAMFAAYFNDPVLSMRAIEKLVSLDACDLFNVWYPAMHEVRQLPRFKELIKEVGLVDYWNKFGWPDKCRPMANGDFECNL